LDKVDSQEDKGMEQSKTQQTPQGEVVCRTWAIYIPSSRAISNIQRHVDKVFSGYSFYPSFDWRRYGFRPPEGHQVLGAWRHLKTRAFAFLLDNPRINTVDPTNHVMLYVVGDTLEVSALEPRIDGLKRVFDLEEKKTGMNSYLGERLDRVSKTRLTVLMTLLGIFTAAINALSLYLRKLPSPELGIPGVAIAYKALVTCIHFGAIFLIFGIIWFVVIFGIKYAALLMRRL